MLTVKTTAIAAVKSITTRTFADSRGSFSETYNSRTFAEHGLDYLFVQDNQAFSKVAGTVRGLHFQIGDAAQNKLVRVLRGRILDVAVDLRRSSPTYGKWVAEELSDENAKQLLVPIGFAHGYCTLEPDTIVHYKVTAHYSPQHERGIIWDDPSVAVDWQLPKDAMVSSDKDKVLPSFESLPTFFE